VLDEIQKLLIKLRLNSKMFCHLKYNSDGVTLKMNCCEYRPRWPHIKVNFVIKTIIYGF